jgi:hypothetical protein
MRALSLVASGRSRLYRRYRRTSRSCDSGYLITGVTEIGGTGDADGDFGPFLKTIFSFGPAVTQVEQMDRSNRKTDTGGCGLAWFYWDGFPDVDIPGSTGVWSKSQYKTSPSE